MSDETKPDQSPKTEDKTSTPPDLAPDFLSDLIISDPVKRNILKALDRLCCAAIDIPVGALERRSAEKWAETEARIKIREGITNQTVGQMKVDPEYAQRAVKKYGEKILREQSNLDKICAIAVNLLKKEKSASSTNQGADRGGEKTINDDWLNSFEEKARQKSTEEMQLRFGRILAGEIEKPGSYSIKTIKILDELDRSAAVLFKRLCSMCTVLGYPEPLGFVEDARMPSLCDSGDANTFWKYGMEFPYLNVLNEYGLIISEYHSSYGYYQSIEYERTQNCYPFWYQGRCWGLRRLPGWKEKKAPFKLWGVSLSQAGRELLRVVEQEPMDGFTERVSGRHAIALQKFFAEHKLQMAAVQLQKELFAEGKGAAYSVKWL